MKPKYTQDSFLRRNTPPEPDEPPREKEYTVSELVNEIRLRVEGRGESVCVRAELGQVFEATSGHVYVDLKDDKAVLNGVIWRSTVRTLGQNLRLETGLEVVCRGRLTTYAPQSKYNLMIDGMEPAGEGALMAMLEKRRRTLAAEGWFDEERKQKLPWLPRVIGVVTSPKGAVIHDIRHRLAHRFPCHVLVWPVPVQGAQCAEEVVAAIEGFNALPAGGGIPRPDLLIVARGGGSLEDLWGFNEESVVRAAGNSSIPLISAIGHESDTTLIDYAADRRAPTPSAAAEMAVPVRADLLVTTAALAQRLVHGMERRLHNAGERLADSARHIRRSADMVALKSRHFDMVERNLTATFARQQAGKRERFVVLQARLLPYSPRRMLERTQERIGDLQQRARRAVAALLKRRAALADLLTARITPSLACDMVGRAQERLGGLQARNRRAIHVLLAAWREKGQRYGELLEACSHKRVLERGFVLVWDREDNLLGRAADVRKGMRVQLEFAGERRVAADIVGNGRNGGKEE